MNMFEWLGKEFVALSGKGKAGMTPEGEAQEILQYFDGELRDLGLSIEHTVRTRLWAKDRESRKLGARERNRTLSGRARSASSSYLAPSHFESEARVAMDLLAMRPSHPDLEKVLKEYDPPIIPLHYLTYDRFVFLSGVTSGLPNLADQMADILTRISGSLADANTSWDKTTKVSFFLHQSQKVETLKGFFKEIVKVEIPLMRYAIVDGFATEGRLVEVEVTATL